MLWRIHERLLPIDLVPFVRTITALGDRVHVINSVGLNYAPLSASDTEEVIVLTTIQDARHLLRTPVPNRMFLYFDETRYNVSYWLPRVASEIPVLNRQCLFMPYGMLKDCPVAFGIGGYPLNDGRVFVRPDSGLKPFTGMVVNCLSENIRDWAGVTKGLARQIGNNQPYPEQMVCVSPARDLAEVEWRFWIVDRVVVASSPYSWEEEQLGHIPPPASAVAIAEMMAKNPWQPDIAYVADVVQLADGTFVLNELNAASTSGVYDVDPARLVPALRDAALREIAGELSIEN